MTKLDCNVVGCSYNEDSCCRRMDVRINGSKAKTPSETCCESFSPKGHGASNCSCTDRAVKDTRVSCMACSCRYNNDCSCTAGHIGISGGHADSRRETECQSFTCCC